MSNRRDTGLQPSKVRSASAVSASIISIDPSVQGGTPVFAGTRVPVRTLFDHLKAGESLAVFLADFPSVTREAAVAVLEHARVAIAPDVHAG